MTCQADRSQASIDVIRAHADLTAAERAGSPASVIKELRVIKDAADVRMWAISARLDPRYPLPV